MTVNELIAILQSQSGEQTVFIEVGATLFDLDKVFLFHNESIKPSPLVLTLKGFIKPQADSELDEVFNS